MDTAGRSSVDVEQQIALIKSSMPGVYRAIQDKATDIGPHAFALVRRGLRGEPDCFYAFEAGHVVGTPFAAEHPIGAEVARQMVRFGVTMCVIFSASADVRGGGDGKD